MAKSSVTGFMEREEELLQALREAAGQLYFASETFGQLSALFQAMQGESESIRELAALGKAVAREWENNSNMAQEAVELLTNAALPDEVKRAA